MLSDPSVCTYQISRIRRLHDGRYVALGQAWHYASGASGRCGEAFSYLLLVASSETAAENGQWTLGMPWVSGMPPNEWDVAELPNGDLLALFRQTAKGDLIPSEAVLHKTGDIWTMGTPMRPPGIASTSRGHPELLATREGVILELGLPPASYTTDGGATWTPLPFPAQGGSFGYSPYYYPRAVQAPDGSIVVFSHVGDDDPYGGVDQSIVMDRFNLVVDG
jgi:hypothetical protein